METIIARQPIFDGQRRLFAYELLYRGADRMSLANVGGNRATSSLLTSSFLTEGLERISANKPCCVNFTEELLLKNIAENFPAEAIIVEILEDVHPTDEVIAVCKKLKNLGYVLALDDFVYHERYIPLIEQVDIVKIDIQHASIDRMNQTIDLLSRYKIHLLAEKVETHEEFELVRRLGFDYFQGYFFARPEVVRIKEMTTTKLTLLSLLFEINKKSVSLERMTKIVSAETALSYRLLRYLNSAYFYLINEIQSIGQAVAYLGDAEIRRFVTLAILSEITSNKPSELVRLAAVRAKFCEQLGIASPRQNNPNELFMLGLFSLLDAMLDCPMADAVGRIPVSDNVKQALIQGRGPIAPFLQVAVAYERGDSDTCFQALQAIGVPKEQLLTIYLSALKFADVYIDL